MVSQQMRYGLDLEVSLAQSHTGDFVHGLEVGTALFHPENSLVSQTEAEVSRYSWKHTISLGALARDAFQFGITGAAEEPLKDVNLDLGVEHV